jgi:chromate transport protein ChrA
MARMPDDPAPRPPEQPRSEPEIIPPDRTDRRGKEFVWTSVDQRGSTYRISIARPGPFSIIVALLIAGLVLGAIVLLLVGLAVIWIPIVIFIIAAFLIAGFTRYYWARFKLWVAHILR